MLTHRLASQSRVVESESDEDVPVPPSASPATAGAAPTLAATDGPGVVAPVVQGHLQHSRSKVLVTHILICFGVMHTSYMDTHV
jgi:hypothetical protein